MEIAGYISSFFIGLSLGLIGGGGSILTLPVLVYLFAVSPALAISYSLFIVGVSSLVGAYNNYRRQLVDLRTVALFGSSSIITVFIVRKFIVPFLPDVLFSIGSFAVKYSFLVMVVFAILMLAASISMIRSRELIANVEKERTRSIFVLYGMLIGLVTGFLGAGGGFLLIPALVIFMKLPMKKAVGSSLLIISLNSLIGFASDLGTYDINWPFLLVVTSIAIAGIFAGTFLNQKVNGAKLKKGFGWFVLIMGMYIIVKEIFFSA